MSKYKWKRVVGEGYDLEGTRYGVRWSHGQDANGEIVGYKREYAVVDLERDENLEWFDYCDEAKRAAERKAGVVFEPKVTHHKIVHSKCCYVSIYRDRVDGGHYCTICDRAVDPKTGRQIDV